MKSDPSIKVLLIEDSPSDVLLLQTALEDDSVSSFTLTRVERLSGALHQLERERFDVILTDLGLPDSSGLDTFERLHRQAPDTPVVVFSGNEDEEQAIHAVRDGAQDYLVKSLSGFDMAARSIRYAIERNKLQSTLRESEKRFTTLFRSNPVPVGITRAADHTIVDVNDAWTSLTGYTREEVVGKSSAVLGLTKPETRQEIRTLLAAGGEIRQFEISLYTRSGDERSVLISSEPIELDGETFFLNNLLDITDRKQADEKLRESKADLAEAQRVARLGSWKLQLATNSISWSDELYRIFDVEPADFGAMYESFLSRVHPEDKSLVLETNRKTRESAEPFEIEYRIETRSKTLRHIREVGYASKDQNGTVMELFGIAQDITEHKQAEMKLRESEEFLRLAYEAADLGVWKNDLLTEGVYFDERSRLHYGFHQSEVKIVDVVNRIHPEDLTRVEAEIAAATSPTGTGKYATEYRVIHPDGSIHWLAIGVRVIFEAEAGQRRAVMGYGTSMDITERKKNEEELKESERRFATAFFTSPVAQSIIAQGTNEIIEVNDSCCSLFGYTHEELIGFPTSKLNLWDDISERQLALKELQETGRLSPREASARMKSGETRTVIAAIEPIAWKGKPSLISFVVDITERKKAEDALRSSEQRLRKTLQTTSEGFWIIDLGGRFLEVNEAYCSMTGYSHEELLQMSVSNVEALETPQDIDERIQSIVREGSARFESRHRRKDDSVFDVEVSVNLLSQESGLIVCFTRDITERKRAEQAALHRQELLEKVIQLGKKIAAITDLEKCLYEIYQSARFGLGFDRIGVFLYNESSRHTFGAYGTTRTGEIQWPGFFNATLEDFGGWQRAVQNPTGIAWQEDYQKQFDLPQDHEMYGVRNHIIAAAWAGEKPVALISADNLLTDRDIKPWEIEALQLFAGYAGLAIENAMLHTELEMKVKERTAEVQDLYDNAPTGYHSLDANGYFTEINATELKWLGYAREEVMGHAFTEFVTEESLAVFQQNFPLFKKRGWVRDLEFELVRKDGSTFPVLLSATAICDRQGNYLMSRSTVFDNTERKKAEISMLISRDELRVAYAALEVASRAKDEFLANMSHELRTPLNSILGMAEILTDQFRGPLNERQQKLVQTIDSSGRHLLSLINDILDLSKIEAGHLEIYPEMISVDRVCQSSLSFLKEPALRKNISLEFITDPAVTMIRADERRLKQILVNLISNAVKFTPERGKVTLKIQVNDSQNAIDISVTDTGVGIAHKDLRRLFTPFTQVDSSLTREQVGTGLGLALVKQLVELHGGGIKVVSEEGHGSCFTISLPWQPSEPIQQMLPGYPSEMETRSQDPASAPVQATILLAEDIETNIMTMGDYLETLGYKMVYARNGRQAIEKAESSSPDLILMDIQMPIMDGLEATRRLRMHPRLASTPIIAITALAMHGDRERCLEAGVNEYISKPVRLKELASLIQRLLMNKEKPGE